MILFALNIDNIKGLISIADYVCPNSRKKYTLYNSILLNINSNLKIL